MRGIATIKMLAGGFAAALNWVAGGCGMILRHPDDGASRLTRGEVRRAAVDRHGAGTKVRIWHDGSGHILPPPPYREEEALYGFGNEFQLRRLLPSLGVMSLERWRYETGDLGVFGHRAPANRQEKRAMFASLATREQVAMALDATRSRLNRRRFWKFLHRLQRR